MTPEGQRAIRDIRSLGKRELLAAKAHHRRTVNRVRHDLGMPPLPGPLEILAEKFRVFGEAIRRATTSVKALNSKQIELFTVGAHGKPEGVDIPCALYDVNRVRGWVVRETGRQGWTYTTRYDKARQVLHVTVGL